jgi:long-chain acyl-CoA synthetase
MSETNSQISFDEAVKIASAPGSLYELEDKEINGLTYSCFKICPQSLRQLYDLGRFRLDNEAIVYEDERYTYKELIDRVDSTADLLVSRLNVKKGDRVAIAMRNYPEWIVAFFATVSVGAVACLLNAWWTEDELEYGVSLSGAKLIIADVERAKKLDNILKKGQSKLLVVRHDNERDFTNLEVYLYDKELELGKPMPYVEIDSEDLATMLFTSGTTGRPKGAVSTHRAVLHGLLGFGFKAAVDVARRSKSEEDEDLNGPNTFILAVPLFHVTGTVPVMMGCYTTGNRLVMMYKWDPVRALELIEREKITVFVGVPTMAHDLLESPEFSKYDTSSLRSIGGGGAPAAPELVRQIDQKFSHGSPQIGYGMTETNGYGPQNSGEDYLNRPTSAGRVVPIMKVRIVGEDGKVLDKNQIGEIEFYGPNLISGYWEDKVYTDEVIRDGWLKSGDLGYLDEDDFIYVVDRVKDMVLRGGENIYCVEVEAVLYEVPEIFEAVVFGVPDERLGEQLIAAVVLKDGMQVSEEKIKQFLSEKLAKFKIPEHIYFSKDQLPRNAAGKFLKTQLRQQYIETHQKN